MSIQKNKSSHSFTEIPSAEISRSKFDRSRGLKTTFDSGWIIPVYLDEILPGDTLNLRMFNFTRLATPLHPVMDNMHLESHFFFVPNRLVWWNWARFNGAQSDPTDTTEYCIPQMTVPVGGHLNGSLSDYFGIPTEEDIGTHMSLPHRGYNLIYQEWYRDENLQDFVNHYPLSDGPDTASNFPLRRRGKRKDYLSSCLPWPQKGTPVPLPIGSTAPVVSTGDGVPTFQNVSDTGMKLRSNVIDFDVDWLAQPTATQAVYWDDTKLVADLTNATASTINEIRQAFQIQKLYERDARGGTRLPEIIKAHFNVTSDDARLQRPEYLGGGTQNISVTPIPQTSATEAGTPQGHLAAFGVSSGHNHGFTKSFTEHGFVFGFVSVRADLNYQQGLDRMWSRESRWDYFWPALQNIGEQAVLNKEIFADGSANDELVWGYQERYGEMRYARNLITGQFRSNFAQSLDPWHLALDFATLPVLDDDFIKEDPPISRIVVDQAEPEFLFDAWFDVKHARPMSTFGVPGNMDRF